MSRRYSKSVFVLFALAFLATSHAETGIDAYRSLGRFELSGAIARADNLILQRDRVKMTFHGVFYLEKPALGHSRGAVFLGKGTFSAEAPPVEFEQDNVRRLLKSHHVESDFQNAVLRFSDDTDSELGAKAAPDAPPEEARRLADKSAPQMLKEIGANIPARVAASVLNGEKPGFFCATFDKGHLGRFTFVMDPQNRVISEAFGVNAGELGLIFADHGLPARTDIWMAFHALDDYSQGRFRYSDSYDQVAMRHYDMDVDVREGGKKKLAFQARMDMEALAGGVQAVPFRINEGLSEAKDERLKRALRIASVKLADAEIPFALEDWETGFTVFLPSPLASGQKFTLTASIAGDFLTTRGELQQSRATLSVLPAAFHSNERPSPQHPSGLLLDLISPTLFYHSTILPGIPGTVTCNERPFN